MLFFSQESVSRVFVLLLYVRTAVILLMLSDRGTLYVIMASGGVFGEAPAVPGPVCVCEAPAVPGPVCVWEAPAVPGPIWGANAAAACPVRYWALLAAAACCGVLPASIAACMLFFIFTILTIFIAVMFT